MGDAAREAEIARGALLSEPIPAREEEPSAALAGSAHECHICGRRGHSSLRALEKHFKACQQVLRRQRRDKLDARMQLRYARRVRRLSASTRCVSGCHSLPLQQGLVLLT